MPELDLHIKELISGDDKIAEEAVSKLATAGKEAVTAMSDLLLEENPDTRWWAVRGLAAIQDVDISNILIEALADNSPEVQYCAAIALREHPTDKAIPDLIELLENKDQFLAHLAGNALAAAGRAATKHLLGVVEEGEWAARVEAVRVLAEIGDHDSISTLFKLLSEDSALIEYWANEGLENMGIGMAFFQPRELV